MDTASRGHPGVAGEGFQILLYKYPLGDFTLRKVKFFAKQFLKIFRVRVVAIATVQFESLSRFYRQLDVFKSVFLRFLLTFMKPDCRCPAAC